MVLSPDGQGTERRSAGWHGGEVRQRRRPRWGEFREAYPRILTAMALGIVALVALDGWVLYKRVSYGRETARLRRSMSDVEKKRADTILAAAEGRMALQVELVRRRALGDPSLNLAVAVDEGKMYLQREGARLREMRVRIGPEVTVGDAPDAIRLVAPRGQRSVLRAVGPSYRWEVPAWVYAQRGQPAPTDRTVEGALGPAAILLDGGTVIYSTPKAGPLADDAYVMPGAVRADAADLDAVLENVVPGMPVFFY
jgi:hypothetical protein